MRINRKPVKTWHVEVHTGGRAGVGAVQRVYASEAEAIAAMVAAEASGNGATCIARNERGDGRLLVLGLIPAI